MADVAQEQERPTKAEVLAMLEERRGIYRAMHNEWVIVEQFLQAATIFRNSPIAEYLLGFPKEFRVKIVPFAKLIRDRGVAQIHTAEVPAVHVELPDGWKANDKAQREAQEKLEG